MYEYFSVADRMIILFTDGVCVGSYICHLSTEGQKFGLSYIGPATTVTYLTAIGSLYVSEAPSTTKQ